MGMPKMEVLCTDPIEQPESGTGNQNPESGIRNPHIMNNDRKDSLQTCLYVNKQL